MVNHNTTHETKERKQNPKTQQKEITRKFQLRKKALKLSCEATVLPDGLRDTVDTDVEFRTRGLASKQSDASAHTSPAHNRLIVTEG